MNDILTLLKKENNEFIGESLFTYKLISTEPTEFLKVEGMDSPKSSKVFSVLIIKESDTLFGYEYETKFVYDVSRNQTDAELFLRRLAEKCTDMLITDEMSAEIMSELF